MNSFLFSVAAFVLGMIALGLFGIFYRSREADRLMAAQLLGTDGVAVLLLLSIAIENSPIVDVALLLALLAAFATIAFVRRASTLRDESSGATQR